MPLAEGSLLALARGREEPGTCNVFLSLRLEPWLPLSVGEAKTPNVEISVNISLVKTLNIFFRSALPPRLELKRELHLHKINLQLC